jgi:type II secretory pathway pseudopilin PulG
MGGASLLETMVVVVIVVVLLAVALNKLIAYQGAAERAAMETDLGALRSALELKFAELVARNRVQSAEALVGSNPMDQLSKPPGNYLGTRNGPDPGSIKGGYWYFDTRTHLLVYRVQHTDMFRGGASGAKRARFQVRMAFADRNGNHQFDAGIDTIEGLRLAAVEPYGWEPSALFPGGSTENVTTQRKVQQ